MEVGLSNVLTVNGELIKAVWKTFDPGLIAGDKHEILMFDKVIAVDNVFTSIGTEIVREDYTGEFTLIEKTSVVEKFVSAYKLELETDDTGVYCRSFLFLTDGKPWAVCNLESALLIKPNIKTIFNFKTNFIINNSENISTNLWDINVNKFNIKYAARIAIVNDIINNANVAICSSENLYNAPSDSLIASELKRTHKAIDGHYTLAGDKLGVKIIAGSKFDINGVKAMFIRILWNVGILVFVDSVAWNGNFLNNLTLVRGHQVELKFGLKFTEIA